MSSQRCIPNNRCLGAFPVAPAFEGFNIGICCCRHELPHRKGLLPAGVFGVVKKIAIDMLGRSSVASESEMRDFSERWRPYRSLALIYAYAVLYADENPRLRFSDA